MLFNSYVFILLFMPLTAIVYFIINNKERYGLGKLYLIVASFAFIFYSGWKSAVAVVVSIAVNYWLNSMIQHKKTKSILISGIAFNVLFLVLFKYSGILSDLLKKLDGGGIFENSIASGNQLLHLSADNISG